jgi:hypothetical protein
MIAAVSFSFTETGAGSAPSKVFGSATAAAAIKESSKKRRRVGVSMVEGIRGKLNPFAVLNGVRASGELPIWPLMAVWRNERHLLHR